MILRRLSKHRLLNHQEKEKEKADQESSLPVLPDEAIQELLLAEKVVIFT